MKKRAIQEMEEARQSHITWLTWAYNNPERQELEIAGDAEHQQQWIENYDRVLHVLTQPSLFSIAWAIVRGALIGWLFYGPGFRKYRNRDEEFFIAILRFTWIVRRAGISFEELAMALANAGGTLEKLFKERR